MVFSILLQVLNKKYMLNLSPDLTLAPAINVRFSCSSASYWQATFMLRDGIASGNCMTGDWTDQSRSKVVPRTYSSECSFLSGRIHSPNLSHMQALTHMQQEENLPFPRVEDKRSVRPSQTAAIRSQHRHRLLCQKAEARLPPCPSPRQPQVCNGKNRHCHSEHLFGRGQNERLEFSFSIGSQEQGYFLFCFVLKL